MPSICHIGFSLCNGYVTHSALLMHKTLIFNQILCDAYVIKVEK